MKWFGFFLCFSGLFFALSGEEPSLPSKTPPDHFYFKESFQEDFHNLFEMLAVEYPDLLKDLNPNDADRALSAVMKAIHSGVEMEHGNSVSAKQSAAVPGKQNPFLRVPGGLIYLRLDSMTPESMEELRKAFDADSRGLIVDLRSCSGGSYSAVAESLEKLLTRKTSVHLALLVSSKTEGPAEILTARLVQNRKGISIGEATAGRPYERKRVTVSTRIWLVPAGPKGAEQIRYAKWQPQIEIPAFPQLSYEKRKTLKDTDSEDRAFLRAADLLISLDLLEKKGLKK